MSRKNKKRKRIFCLNFEASQEYISSLDQFSLFINVFKKDLIKQVIAKGYKPLSKPKVMSFADLQSNVEHPMNKYRLSIKAIYVGKKKAKEILNVT